MFNSLDNDGLITTPMDARREVKILGGEDEAVGAEVMRQKRIAHCRNTAPPVFDHHMRDVGLARKLFEKCLVI